MSESEKINWEKVKEWDEKYYIHLDKTKEEYEHVPIESTQGDYLIMPDGTKLLDFFNQLYCVNAGQKNPEIQEAIKEATDRYGFVWEAFVTDYRAKAAKLIIEDVLGQYDWPGKVSFANSGSEAVEKAMIISKLYTNRQNIVTREHAYHGATMGAAGATRLIGVRSGLAGTEKEQYRQVPAHPGLGFIIAPAPNCFDCSLGHEYPDCKSRGDMLPCILATERVIKSHGVDSVAAMITEPSFGAGSIVPPEEYLPQIRQLTRKLGIVWIVDEVLTGFGRKGEWFAHQLYDVEPDIMTMAKGIVNSALPAAGIVVSKDIASFMDEWRWWTVSTFAAHPISMAAVCANIEYMIKNDLVKQAKEAGKYFGPKLQELEEKHDCVGQVAGSGMLWNVEIVKNKATRERFAPEDRHTTYSGDLTKYPSNFIFDKALEKGVLIGGFAPNTLRIGASLNVSKESMDKAIDALDYAFTELDKYTT